MYQEQSITVSLCTEDPEGYIVLFHMSVDLNKSDCSNIEPFTKKFE